MIDVKDAVASAIAYTQNFPDLLKLQGVRLEETEVDDRKGEWAITLSFMESPGNPIINTRQYKVFRIDGESGQVISMKTRTPF